jgi:hypothetical protein
LFGVTLECGMLKDLRNPEFLLFCYLLIFDNKTVGLIDESKKKADFKKPAPF